MHVISLSGRLTVFILDTFLKPLYRVPTSWKSMGQKVSWKVMKKSWKIGLAQKVMESGQREKNIEKSWISC